MLALLYIGSFSSFADTYSTHINQQINGGQWIELGSFTLYGGTDEYLEISNTGAVGYIIADAVRITGNGITNIIDDADLSSSQKYGTWGTSSATAGYYGSGYSLTLSASNDPLKWIRFPLEVPQSGTYSISMNWTAAGNRAPSVPVKIIYNNIPALRTLTVMNGSGSGSYVRGTEVELTASAPAGAGAFSRWRSSTGTFRDSYAPFTLFTMPDEDTTATADYRETLPPVRETARLLPVAAEVDIAVVGSGIGAIGTAVEAAKAGASVLLLCPNSYLGQDMAGENRYWLNEGEVPASELAQTLFGTRDSSLGRYCIKPGFFKKQAESVLQSNNVAFLYGVYAVDAVVDSGNDLAGVVIADKGGRQVVRAKVIVDATSMGGFAQLAGADMEPRTNTEVSVSRTHYFYDTTNSVGSYAEFTTNIYLEADSWMERCRAETQLRQLFDTGNESWSAQYMHAAEPDSIIGEAFESAVPWIGAAYVDLGVCKPHNKNYLYVIGQACSVSRTNAAALARPLEMLELGQRLGTVVQSVASARTRPVDLHVNASVSGTPDNGLNTAESLTGIRPFQQVQRISQPERTLPVDGQYDVIVVGGGSSGAPAAIGAARAGAKVLLIEQLGILGGTGVNGIGVFSMGYRYGFAVEHSADRWLPNAKACYYRKELEKAGAEIRYNTMACGVIKNSNTVCGVVTATPLGRRAVLGRTVIDCTGDGDIYTWAGAGFEFGCGEDGNFAMLDSGFFGDDPSPTGYQNYAGVFTDPSDIYSATWFRILHSRYAMYTDKFDFYPLSGIRMSRRLVGDYVITALDQYRGRTYADTISIAKSNWDAHGFHKGKACYAGLFPDGISYVPYRALLPRGLEGLLVAGRCISAEHDALPIIRMQADVANQGYASGVAAAMCIKAGVPLRDVDIPSLQDHLRSIGNLPNTNEFVCADMPDPTDAEIQTAIVNLSVTNSDGASPSMAVLLVDPARSVPFLLTSFLTEPTVYKAKALCFCGDTNGVPYLTDWLNQQALGPVGGNGEVKPVDSIIRALGYAPSVAAIPALTNKLAACTSTSLSHTRALALTLGDIGNSQAVPALVSCLQKSGITNAMLTVDYGLAALNGPGGNANTPSGHPNYYDAEQELFLETALYRCGDTNDLARGLLSAYLNDWRGPLRRFAAEVLSSKCTPNGVPYSWFEKHGIVTKDYVAAETVDSDGDGFPNWQEFWAGTDPCNADSVFRIEQLTDSGQLTWQGGTNSIGTPFRVYGSTNLTTPWSFVMAVQGSANSTTDCKLPGTWSNQPSLFIKLEASTSN